MVAVSGPSAELATKLERRLRLTESFGGASPRGRRPSTPSAKAASRFEAAHLAAWSDRHVVRKTPLLEVDRLRTEAAALRRQLEETAQAGHREVEELKVERDAALSAANDMRAQLRSLQSQLDWARGELASLRERSVEQEGELALLRKRSLELEAREAGAMEAACEKVSAATSIDAVGAAPEASRRRCRDFSAFLREGSALALAPPALGVALCMATVCARRLAAASA